MWTEVDLRYLQAASDIRRCSRRGRLGADVNLVLGITLQISHGSENLILRRKILDMGVLFIIKRHTDTKNCVP